MTSARRRRGTNRILHHTIGLTDFQQEARCFKEVVCSQVPVVNIAAGSAQSSSSWAPAPWTHELGRP